MKISGNNSAVSVNSSISAPKRHYEILDGLRGVAAVMVLIFHIFEAHTITCGEDIMAHGYLAVDFFFVLSGFVIGYAYDDRWGTMSFSAFVKRRLIRLHPLVIFGMIVGAVFFYFGASKIFSLIAETPLWTMLLFTLLGMLLIPVPPSGDIRGWEEMYTIDAPVWSLFFEYIANLLYGLFVRRFSKTILCIFVFLSACATVYISVFKYGDVSGGWTLDEKHMQIGFTRMMYPFFAGLLLIAVLAMPAIDSGVSAIGSGTHTFRNGLYEAAMIIIVFPLIVYFGASGEVKGKYASKFCSFLGKISYPLYIVHYPVMYVYTGWVTDNGYSVADTYPTTLLVFFGSIALAYFALKCYDEPVRKLLRKKYRVGN